MNFRQLSKLVDLRGKTKRKGSYANVGVNAKTDIAVHHSLTTSGNSAAFANYHVGTNGWPGVAYHFVILKDGTIEWNHDLGIKSYHVGNSNRFAIGICLVGDFRSEKPTAAQETSFRALVTALKKDMPNYKRTRGHNEFPGYSWKACPVFDYKEVLAGTVKQTTKAKPVKSAPSKSTSKPKTSTSKKTYNLPSGVLKVTKPLTKGAGVKAVQEALSALFFYPEKGAKNHGVDGYYGPKTANAVKRFQLMNGLTADGIYGPKTKKAIEKSLK
ncbi:N-acetylmuramoyl-L-alanine amidase [Bacillus altitudinis]|nr:N-acetylmuramoyl-L-alanine amidase [Bacillus altitudinis]MDN0040568.1 N-acetylmuramoyl-L-alanine amidase [Bacillus aerophilus]WLF28879.1 N-acetylmuramoyl-L-alanine amidase [Bacillus altitudinis]